MGAACCRNKICCGRSLKKTTLSEFLEDAQTGDVVLFDQNTVQTPRYQQLLMSAAACRLMEMPHTE